MAHLIGWEKLVLKWHRLSSQNQHVIAQKLAINGSNWAHLPKASTKSVETGNSMTYTLNLSLRLTSTFTYVKLK
ncbi:ClbS/DfsB family four-helix bundle protein [Pseudoalteromonas maricaloris]|uniref:ClbS/DfsB family four-helix bundle protein n=1 Tax=Pseudoalteromonas maricaloris TaxID=184924 RepID=UPI00351D64A2